MRPSAHAHRASGDAAAGLPRRTRRRPQHAGVGFVLPGFTSCDAAGGRRRPPVNSWLAIGTRREHHARPSALRDGPGLVLRAGADPRRRPDGRLRRASTPSRAARRWPIRRRSAPRSTPSAAASRAPTTGRCATPAPTAREMLVQAAMNRNGDPTPSNYTVADGVITHVPSRRDAAPTARSPPTAALLHAAGRARRWCRTPSSSDRQDACRALDIPLEGRRQRQVYGLDIRLPNMVYAVIKHCPTFGGTLASDAGDAVGDDRGGADAGRRRHRSRHRSGRQRQRRRRRRSEHVGHLAGGQASERCSWNLPAERRGAEQRAVPRRRAGARRLGARRTSPAAPIRRARSTRWKATRPTPTAAHRALAPRSSTRPTRCPTSRTPAWRC